MRNFRALETSSQKIAVAVISDDCLECTSLVSPDTQSVGHAIDVVEPGCDQCDLEDRLVIKTSRPQALVIFRCDARGVVCELQDVFKHFPVLLGNRRSFIIFLQSLCQLLIQSNAPQKLCVRFDSIMTTIGD